MDVRGFFKNVLNQDQVVSEESQNSETTDDQSSSPSGMSGFLSSTSRFLDSVQTKKNGLLTDISTKLGSIKLPGDTILNAQPKKRRGGDDGDDSSASEYGDEGDKPLYAEEGNFERTESVDSVDSLGEDEATQLKTEVHGIVEQVFQTSSISAEMEADFQNYIMRHTGRSAYAKELRNHVKDEKSVSDSVLHGLAQLTSHVLVHCNENDDFTPATLLMQAGFTFFTEHKPESFDQPIEQTYMYMLLRDQPIWQSMRFWNAAFFNALQSERRKRTSQPKSQGEDALQAEKEMQTNIAFAEISQFMWRMHAVGIAKEPCLDFLRKQASSENVSKEKFRILKENLKKLYAEQTDDQSIL